MKLLSIMFVATVALTITSPSRADVAAGADAFKSRCASCHGADGKGPLLWQNGKPKPSDLTEPRMREHVDGEIYWVVTNGITESGMPASAAQFNERTAATCGTCRPGSRVRKSPPTIL